MHLLMAVISELGFLHFLVYVVSSFLLNCPAVTLDLFLYYQNKRRL